GMREEKETREALKDKEGILAEPSMEYHKGEARPYAEKMSQRPLLCQEGFCYRCQVWIDFKQAQGEADKEDSEASYLNRG
ncbi:unnamed protein product, partial [marine sediment metagenome]